MTNNSQYKIETSPASILLAGGPGSGKSTISQVLRDRGMRSIDLDFGFARWEDLQGRPVTFPAEPCWPWLQSHRWRWQADRLDAAVAEADNRPVVYAGTASNMFDLLDRFDRLLLLQMDDATRQRRLADPRRGNVFGRVGDTAAWSSWWHRTVERELIQRGATVIDTQRPIHEVVSDVVEYVNR